MLKTKFTPLFISFFVLCLSFSNAHSQNPNLEKIFASAIEAVGGDKEIKKIRSIEASAECLGPSGKYSTEIISFRNEKTRFTQKFSYKEATTNILINNKSAWQTSDLSPVSSFQKLVVHLHEYQRISFDFQKIFHDFLLEGTEVFEKRPSFKVKAKNELEGAIYLYFDQETKLLSGYILPIPNSKEIVKNVFNEWRLVGKLKLPSKITATDNSGNWILNFHKISLNKSDEKIFEIPPRINDQQELLKLHEQQKTAHLTYNAELFIEMFAENLTQLQKGNVSTSSKEESLTRFKKYFSNFKFIEWENLKPPIIKISQDGTMATIIVQKRVRGTYKNDKGDETFQQTDFAWLEVWEKQNGKWKIVTVASTEKVLENSK